MRYSEKWPVYARQWDAMVIKPARVEEFVKYASFAIEHQDRYKEIERRAKVRWYHIAVIHRRESNADFNTYLGNGQSLHRITTEVPHGRGPFASFEEGAIDALRIDGLTSVIDWRLEKILYYCEVFNGGGYSRMGLPSPYVWGGSSIQKIGKFVRDHEFDYTEWDGQPGCAPMLKTMQTLDASIDFIREN